MQPTHANAGPNGRGIKGFAYRESDGSCNNPLMPELGAAHKPYARSVASSHVAPVSTLPDPGLVFDTLLKRDTQVEHPTGLSSMFFAFANLIIHSLFRTNRRDDGINDTSSYLDLSPLYGVDQAEQNGVRRFDGTGRLWNDVFADVRLLGMPPAIAALLIIFNRNHNVWFVFFHSSVTTDIVWFSSLLLVYSISMNRELIPLIPCQLTMTSVGPRMTRSSIGQDSLIGAFGFLLLYLLLSADHILSCSGAFMQASG